MRGIDKELRCCHIKLKKYEFYGIIQVSFYMARSYFYGRMDPMPKACRRTQMHNTTSSIKIIMMEELTS